VNPIERTVRRVDRFQQSHRPLAIGFGILKKFGDDRAGSLAALIAYYGFLAAFPLLLMLTTVTGFVAGRYPSFEEALLDSALRDFPVIGTQFNDAIHPIQGSALGLAIGTLGLVWGSLGVTQAAQHAMAEVWNVPGVDRPPFVKRLARGLSLFALMGVGLVVTTIAASLSTFGDAPAVTRAAGFVLSGALNVALFLAAFRILTVRSISLRCLVPGAFIGGIRWSILQALAPYLVDHHPRYASQIYGYFASVLGLVSWLFLGAQLTLYAAEANVVWKRRLWPRSIVQPPLTEADKRAFDDIALQGERRPEQSVESSWDAGETTAD